MDTSWYEAMDLCIEQCRRLHASLEENQTHITVCAAEEIQTAYRKVIGQAMEEVDQVRKQLQQLQWNG